MLLGTVWDVHILFDILLITNFSVVYFVLVHTDILQNTYKIWTSENVGNVKNAKIILKKQSRWIGDTKCINREKWTVPYIEWSSQCDCYCLYSSKC